MSGRGDAVGWDCHRGRHPHQERRSRSVAAVARRAAGAFLLATFALFAFPPVASVAVADDEESRLEVRLDRTSVAEGAGATTVTVTVSYGSGAVVPSTSTAVAVSVGAGVADPATPGTDFTAVGDFTITIPADTASATGTFTFTPVRDDLVERDEAVLVRSTAAGYLTVPQALTITDDDITTLSIANAGAPEGEDMVFAVSLTKAVDTDIRVGTTTYDDTARAPGDYAAQTASTVTVPAGRTRVEVRVPTVEDTLVEEDERFGLLLTLIDPDRSLSLPSGYAGRVFLDATGSLAVGTITDDNDPRGVTVTPTALTVTEAAGAQHSATYTVVLTSEPTGDVTVTPVSGDTGIAAVPGGALTFTPGNWNTAQTVTVTGVDDGLDNAGDRRATTVTHTVAGGGYGGETAASVAVTVTDDDEAPRLSISSPSVTEGDDGQTATLSFEVTLSAASGRTVTVDYAEGAGTATAGADYEALDAGTLTFAPGGPLSQTVAVTVTGDDVDEPDETVVVELSGAVNATVSTATGTGTIADDEESRLEVRLDRTSVAEGAGATTVTVTVSYGSGAVAPSTSTAVAVSVGAGVADPATPGTDFTAVGDFTITIPADTASATGTFTFTPVRDDLVERDEAVLVRSTAAGYLTVPQALTITDDDITTLSIANAGAPEGEDMVFAVSLTKAVDTDIRVGTTTYDDTARAPGDYAARTASTVTVPAGRTRVEVRVPTVEDTLVEEDERFGLLLTLIDPDRSLSLPSGYAGRVFLDATGSLAVGTITDDDVAAAAATADEQPPWTLELVRDDRPFATVTETDADAAYPSTFLRLVRGSSTAPLPAHLPVTVGGTAANPADYEFNHGNVFASLSRKSADLMRGARKITVKGDDVDEGAETITFSVTIEGETLTATLTITDDDAEAQPATEASNDATLSGLAVSQGRLSAAFDAATTAYGAIVPEAASSIAVTPTAADADATVTVNGVTVESGSPSGPIAVSEGSVVTVRVTAPDGATTQDYVLTVDPQAPWILRLVREDRPFTTVAEMEADAAYPSTFLRLERGSSRSPIPDWLPVTVGGTATNPADYEFNQGNQFRGITRKSDDLMRGARKFTIKGDGVAEGAETITFSVTIEGRTLTATLTIAEPRLAVADASVQEAAGAALAFRVTLEPQMGGPVTVDWGTADGSAVAGQDYTAASGTLTFAAGETEKTISVAVLDDEIDEGSETMTLTLSNPAGAVLGDAEAVGTIANTDHMPQAWLARFGRTVADQVIDAVTARFEAAPQAGSAVNIAGQALGAGGSPEAQAACGTWRAAHRERHGLRTLADDGNRAGFGAGTGGLGERCRSGTRALTGRDLLTGSSFSVTGGSAETGFGTVWGSGAVTRFDGREGGLTLDGDVASALLGADFRRDRATMGLALAHSRGDGSYRGAGSGEVESTLTGLYPYGRYEASERLSLWGIAGWGSGTLTLTPEGGEAVKTDTDMTMGAAGARGVLAEAPDGGGPELAVKSDVLLLHISSDSARDGAGGRLAAADADVTRLRLGLEGTWRGVGTLTPTLEAGLRHDGGDAETGFGVEAGAGLAWTDPASGIAAELKARGLLAHEDGGFRERSVSGSFAWDPAPGSDRGPSLTLAQTLGGPASGGVDALFRDDALTGLDANDAGFDARRFEAKLGYGFGALGDRFTLTPELGFGLSNDSRTYGLGWRFAPSGGGSSFELRLEATRREAANDNSSGSGPEHKLTLNARLRW